MGFWDFWKSKIDRVKKIEDNLMHSFSNIKNDMHIINKILAHFKSKHDNTEGRLERIEKELLEVRKILQNRLVVDEGRSIVHERSNAFKRSNEAFMNVQTLKSSITPAQKRVIHVLSFADVPLEYADLAKELGISIVTVRRHLNDVKRLGFDVKEKVNVESGRKVFFLENVVKKAVRSKK